MRPPKLFFLLCSLLLGLCPALAQAPRLVVPDAVYNFGQVDQGEVVTHQFSLMNKGAAPLLIQRIVASCGCTATKSKGNSVPPSGETTIEVRFDTGGFSGEKLKTVRVFTNDPSKPSTVLSLRGRVLPEVVIEPQRVSFGELIYEEPFQSAERIVQLRVRESADAEIEKVVSRSPYIEFEEEKMSGGDRRLSLRLTGEIPLGEFRDRIVVHAKGAAQSSFNIPVYASIRGSVQLKPRSVGFGIVEGEAPITREIEIVNRGSKPIAVDAVKPGHRSISARYEEIEAGRRYRVLLTLNPGELQKNLKTSVKVHTDSEENEELTLSVTAAVKPRSLLKDG